MPAIPATQERSGGSWFKASSGKWFARPYLKKKKNCKKGLVEWLKVKALSANPSITKRKKKNAQKTDPTIPLLILKYGKVRAQVENGSSLIV
jgi:hypothetical protein